MRQKNHFFYKKKKRVINREEEEEGRKTLVMNFLGGFLLVYVMEIGVLVRV